MAVDRDLLRLAQRGYLNLTDRDTQGDEAGAEQFGSVLHQLVELRANDPDTLADTVAEMSHKMTAMLLDDALVVIGERRIEERDA